MSNHTTEQRLWLFVKDWQPEWPKAIKLLNKYERWRKVGQILKLSKTTKVRLEWIIYYYQGYNVSEVNRHFGISRKTFHKWFRGFDQNNLYSLYRLEDKSRAPNRIRQRQIAYLQKQRIIELRKKYIRYGKEKLAIIYRQQYNEKILLGKSRKSLKLKSFTLALLKPLKQAEKGRFTTLQIKTN